MRVTDRYFGPIWYAQAQFNPSVTPIDVHFGKWRRKKHIIVREESAVSIVPTAKFGKTGLDVTELRLRQLDLYVVIVGIPDPVAVDRKQAVLAERPLKVQVLDAAVRLIAWQPVLLLELCLIAAGDYSANPELDPVLVLSGCSSVVAAVVDLLSLVSPARTAAAAKIPAQTNKRNLQNALIYRRQYLSSGVTLDPCGSSWQPADQQVPCGRKFE